MSTIVMVEGGAINSGNKGKETHLRNRQDELTEVVRKSQSVLARHIQPDSTLSDSDALSELYGILDNKELYRLMEEDL